ncbi:MAG: hypothetical protein IKW74_00240, partial [Thermoguttaceae bacterium]|nr:hypothetical protein [Thermoguttaceae bacterium]
MDKADLTSDMNYRWQSMKYTIFASGSFLFQSVLFGMVLTFSGINTWVQGAERLGHSPKTDFV